MNIFRSVFVGIIVTTVLTFVSIICFSLILTKANIDEGCMSTVVTVIFGISILCGTFISTRKVKKNGAFIGGLMAVSYMLVMYVISSSILGDFSLNTRSIIMISSAIMLGILGGVIGVNIK